MNNSKILYNSELKLAIFALFHSPLIENVKYLLPNNQNQFISIYSFISTLGSIVILSIKYVIMLVTYLFLFI